MQYPQHKGRSTALAGAGAAMPARPRPTKTYTRCAGLAALLMAAQALPSQAMTCSLPAAGELSSNSSNAGLKSHTPKFRLIEQSCAELAQPVATVSTPAAAPRSAQLDLYDSEPLSGTLQAGRTHTGGPERLAPAEPPGTTRPSLGRRADASQRILGVAATLSAAAERHDIDPLLLHAIAHVESRHNTQAVSPAGARGLMQVMPATAKRFGLKDPVRELMQAPLNVEASAAYLKTLQARFGNDLRLVLAAYNAGEGAVERHGRTVPPYAETRAYVQQVLGAYQGLRDWVATAPGAGHAANTATR